MIYFSGVKEPKKIKIVEKNVTSTLESWQADSVWIFYSNMSNPLFSKAK